MLLFKFIHHHVYKVLVIGNTNVSLISGGTSGTEVFVSGGTYSAGTATFTNTTGGTFQVTGFSTSESSVSKFVATTALTANIVTTISHTINSEDVVVQVKNSSGEFTLVNTINNYQPYSVDIETSVSGTYKIIIIG